MYTSREGKQYDKPSKTTIKNIQQVKKYNNQFQTQ